MAFPVAQLAIFYTNASFGADLTPGKVSQLGAIANSGVSNTESAIQAGLLLNDTVGVAALSYAYFGKSLPSAAGMSFLVHSDANAADLSDPYYAQFNQENRFLNFSFNLALAAASPYSADLRGQELRRDDRLRL